VVRHVNGIGQIRSAWPRVLRVEGGCQIARSAEFPSMIVVAGRPRHAAFRLGISVAFPLSGGGQCNQGKKTMRTAAQEATPSSAAIVRSSLNALNRAGPPAECVASLRERALSANACTSVDIGLRLLWRELSLGLCRVSDSFSTEERCFLVTETVAGPALPITGRRLEILEGVLCGVVQKKIAIEMAVAASTVALNARLALGCLGVNCRPSRVHPLLMLAAKASQLHDGKLSGSLSFLGEGASQLRVISVPRPDRWLERVLPRAELAVVRSLVEGASYREIAEQRATSTRTIANQITAVFRRMRVSGRSELLLRLFACQAAGETLTPANLGEESVSAS
jgi:DNA-binding NarL/FixJ family response regulator